MSLLAQRLSPSDKNKNKVNADMIEILQNKFIQNSEQFPEDRLWIESQERSYIPVFYVISLTKTCLIQDSAFFVEK